jgi:hypothetical protein
VRFLVSLTIVTIVADIVVATAAEMSMDGELDELAAVRWLGHQILSDRRDLFPTCSNASRVSRNSRRRTSSSAAQISARS